MESRVSLFSPSVTEMTGASFHSITSLYNNEPFVVTFPLSTSPLASSSLINIPVNIGSTSLITHNLTPAIQYLLDPEVRTAYSRSLLQEIEFLCST